MPERAKLSAALLTELIVATEFTEAIMQAILGQISGYRKATTLVELL